MVAYLAVLAVHGDAGEVAHVLVGACQLVEQRRLAAVLVAHQGKSQDAPMPAVALGSQRLVCLGVGMAVARVTLLAVAWMGYLLPGQNHGGVIHRARFHLDACRLGLTQRQAVAIEVQFHGVAHGGVLHYGDLGSGDEAHVQQVLSQGSFSLHLRHKGRTAHFHIAETN